MIIKSLLCAVSFLTVLPFGKRAGFSSKELARSMAFYPLVGYFIGALTYGFFHLISQLLPPVQATVFAFICGILLTGALHLDGFADSVDGFYAGKSKGEILDVMRDAHLGTMAVVGLFSLLTIKLTLLLSLETRGVLQQAFILPCMVGRWMMVVATSFYPYARSGEGAARPFVEEISWKESSLATLILFVLLYGVLHQEGVKIGIIAFFLAMVILRWAAKKIGGITGDVLGGLNEVTEVIALLLMHFFVPTPKSTWAI